MVYLAIRYDLRNPAFANTSTADRYGACLEQCEWADRLGFDSVTLSEHHGVDDGYLPSLFAMAAAIAARTTNIRIRLGAVIAPLHDPLRLAEDAAVLDNISRGRLDLVLANGYVPSEFTAFGVSMRDRARLVTEAVATLRSAWTGDPFEFRGRTARVTPRPFQSPGPAIHLGGATEAAARRAARIADGFMPTEPHVFEFYRNELVKLGKPDPGPMGPGAPMYTHVTNDIESTWTAVAPHALHEMNAYGAWAAESGTATGYVQISEIAALRAMGLYQVVTPDACVEFVRASGMAMLHPMMGGVTPELSWENLRLFEHEVLPRIR